MAYELWTVEWDMPTLVYDPFRRYVSYSWGVAPGGLAYATTGGTPDNFNVDGARGTITLPTGDTASRTVLLPDDYTDVDVRVTFQVSQLATGASINEQLRFRSVDGNNFYTASLAFDTVGTVDVSLLRTLLGATTALDSAANHVSYAADSDVHVWVQMNGSELRAKVWAGDVDVPPAAWTVEATDASHPVGKVGVRAVLSGGNTNTNVMVRVDNLLLTVDERWVDITRYVETAAGTFQITDGDTPEASADTGGFGLPLQNSDQRFTPGNILSPYAPNIAPGSRIRVRETIADKVFHRGFGYVQYPEISAWTASSSDSPRDQMITIPVIDRGAWIAQGRTMVSTLGEHILHHAGPSMVAYWPMDEVEGPDVNPAVGAPWTLTVTKQRNTGDVTTNGQPEIAFASAGIAPADDISSIVFSPTSTTTPAPEYVDSLMLVGTRPTPLILEAGQVLTVVCWTRPGEQLAGASAFTLIEVAHGDPVFGPSDTFAGVSVVLTGELFARVTADTWSANAMGPVCPQDQGIPVALRVGFTPNVCELWVRGEVYASGGFGGVVGPWTFDDLNISWLYPGAVNHAQVYLGDPDDWTHADFLAQHQMGLTGLERQTTGERIRTVLEYAGVDPAELGRIDDGASLMQVARLAGRNPMDVVSEAVATEQGELYVDGGGQFVFADRVRLYNV